jgi:hypothetical protein
MIQNQIKLEFTQGKLPYNSKVTIQLPLLKDVMPILKEEILKGLVDTLGEDMVILHLNLTEEKILLLNGYLPSSKAKKIA